NASPQQCSRACPFDLEALFQSGSNQCGERVGCTAHLNDDTFTHTFEHRDAVILCHLCLMWATKESSRNPYKSSFCGKNNLLLRLKCSSQWRPGGSKQPRRNPCGLLPGRVMSSPDVPHFDLCADWRERGPRIID
ncbi:hypothetical protein KUDE01_031698, partial [Dissostichus eleginoides]